MKCNYKINKEGFIVYQGDTYFPKRFHYEGYPFITGMPEITWKDFVTNIRRNIFTKRPQIQLLPTPKDCALRHVVNYPIRKWGAFQCGIIGTYGFGKSNLLNLLMAFLLARNHRLLMFDDDTAEFRTLAGHGYFDKNDTFHPFIIDVFIPEGYEFDEEAENHNPIWLHRKNVHVKEFTDPTDIIDNLKPHILTVVYTPAFDEASTLRIWITLMNILKTRTSVDKSYIFVMHEFADLFPEGAQKEIYQLLIQAMAIVKRMRKNRQGILSSYHENADVSYKFSRKFGFIFQKRSVNKKSLSQLEEYSRRFNRSQVAISQAGYFREHTIKKFPEVKDKYRIAPNPTPFYYSLETGIITAQDLADMPKDKKDLRILELYKNAITNLEYQDYTQKEIADVFNVSQQFISKVKKQIQKLDA